MTLLIIYLFLAIAVSFLCSILEAVLLSVSPSYITSLEDSNPQKQRWIELKTRIDDAISAILILNTFAHTIGAAGVGAEAVHLFGIQWQSLIAVILTLLILFFSEIIPKTIGATYWRELSRISSFLIKWMVKLLFPLIILSNLITSKIKKSTLEGPTREEIVAMAEIGEETGILEAKESKIIENLLSLSHNTVKDILTPRSVVFSLEASQIIDNIINDYDDVFIYSRIPVYEKNHDNIIGKVFSSDILKAISLEEGNEKPISSILKPVHFVPDSLPVVHLLDQFIDRREHLFIVLDHYNQFVGIVTLEDAIETLLGREIIDEKDKVADMQKLALEKALHWKKRIKQTGQ